MAEKRGTDQRFEDLLEGRSSSASPEMERLAKLASALSPSHTAGPGDQFRRRLRSELLAKAATSDEDVFAAAIVGSPQEAPAEVRQLVAVAAALAPARLPVPDPAFRFQLRASLIEQAHTAGLPVPVAWLSALNTKMRRSARVVAATAMAAVMLTGSAAALVAAQGALPGDALYGIKRLHEGARLLPLSGEAEGLARLALARERLSEVEGLVERGTTEESLYIGTLDDMDELTTSGTQILLDVYRATRDAELTDFVATFATEQIDTLTVLMNLLPPGVRPAAQDSLQIVRRAAAEVVRTLIACGSCPADPAFTSPTARVEAGPADAFCECAVPAGSTADPSGSGSGGGSGTDPNGGGGTDDGSNGGGDTDEEDPTVDVPDELPDDIEKPGEDLIDQLIEELEPLPLPSPMPTLPTLDPGLSL